MAAYDPWTKSAGGQWITFGLVQVRKLAGSDAGGLNACILCALFTISAGTCTSSILGMTDCPSTVRSRAGQGLHTRQFWLHPMLSG